MPLATVRETMRPLPVQALPSDLPGVLGVSRIRGMATPVIGLAALLGGVAGTPGRFVRMDLKGRAAALAVEEVVGVRRIEERMLLGLPPLLQGVRTEVVQSIATRDGELLLVLDAMRIIPEWAWELLRTGGAP